MLNMRGIGGVCRETLKMPQKCLEMAGLEGVWVVFFFFFF